MAFRRSAPSRGRSFNSSSRFSRFKSRNRTHQPKRTGHWQRANLRLDAENVVSEEGVNFNTVLVIAQIDNHLGDDLTEAGRLETNTVKFLEIGGIVFDWQMVLTDQTLDFTTPPTTDVWRVENQIILASDRLDEEGNPVAILSNWFTSTTPIPVAASTQQQDEDQRFPTRVHWRHARTIAGGYGPFPDITGNYQPSQSVVSLQGSANLRLRLALDDEHALTFHWTSVIAQNASTLSAAAVNLTVNGSMYYRVRY